VYIKTRGVNYILNYGSPSVLSADKLKFEGTFEGVGDLDGTKEG